MSLCPISLPGLQIVDTVNSSASVIAALIPVLNDCILKTESRVIGQAPVQRSKRELLMEQQKATAGQDVDINIYDDSDMVPPTAEPRKKAEWPALKMQIDIDVSRVVKLELAAGALSGDKTMMHDQAVAERNRVIEEVRASAMKRVGGIKEVIAASESKRSEAVHAWDAAVENLQAVYRV